MSTSIHALSDLSQPGMIPGSGATPEAYEDVRRRRPNIQTDWESFFTQLTSRLEQEERAYDWIKYREGLRNQAYYEGNFFHRISEETGQIRDIPHSDEDPFYPHNWFQYFVDLSVSAALEASPDIVVDPSTDDDHNIAAARSAQRLVNYAEMELMTEEFKLESEKTRQLYCGIWWYSYWSMDAGTLFASRPEFEAETNKATGDAFLCGTSGCENMGPTERLINTATGPTCPQCKRSDNLQILRGPETTVHKITGYKKVPIGFPVLEAVSPLQMRGDRRAGHYMRGGHLCRTRSVDRDVVADQIKWWDPERASGGGSSDDYGVRAEEIARRPAGNAKSNAMAEQEPRDVVVKQWWLRPYRYADVEFQKDAEFIGKTKTTIKAGTKLGEVFPDGLYLLKVGNKWLDHNGEDFRKKWVYAPYVYLPHKVDGGSTVSAMTEPQREMIEVNSLLFLYLKARAGGAPTIIKSPLSETDFDGSPATITRLPAGAPDLDTIFFQPQFPPADQNLTQYANRMSGEMQIMAQVVSPTTSGDPSAQEMGGTDTARGMMIMNAKSQGLQGPKLMPVAYAQAQAVQQWIELFRDNVVDDIPIPLKGKQGESEWFMINGSDLEGDFAIYPKPKSWLPHPREEKQAALQNAFTTFGQILLNPDAPASLKDRILEDYGIEDVDLDDYGQETRDAMLRIDKLEEMIPQATQLAQWYAQQVANQPPIPAQPGPVPPGPPEMPGAAAMPVAPPDVSQSAPQAAPQAPPAAGAPPEEAPEPLPTDPAELAGALLAKMVPVDPDLDDPGPYMDYYKSWLKGDEGRDANPILRAAVKAQWKQYNQMVQDAQKAQMDQQIQQAGALAAAQAQAQMPIEQAKQQGGMAQVQAKGQIELQKIAATPPEPMQMGPAVQPLPPDTTVRDRVLDAAIAGAQEDQKHYHKMDELGFTNKQKMRQQLAQGAMSALSKAGVGGNIVADKQQVPALGGLPSQAAW